MKTIFIKYYDPKEVTNMSLAELTDRELIKYCFRVFKCSDEGHALMAYAETPCTWSTLLDDSITEKDLQGWISEAISHIRKHDYDWLEANFT